MIELLTTSQMAALGITAPPPIINIQPLKQSAELKPIAVETTPEGQMIRFSMNARAK